jgi:hypothetical protein
MSVGNLMKNVVTVAQANDAATLVGFPSSGMLSCQVTGAFTGTITFEATCDGSNWVAAHMNPVGQPESYSTATTTASAAGIFNARSYAYTGFRARCSAISAGTPVVSLKFSGV